MKRAVWIALSVVLAGAAFAYVRQNAITIHLDGSLVSERGLMHEGEVYVPLKDVAAATGRDLTVEGSAAKLEYKGGQNEQPGVAGKVGATLFNGVTRLTAGTPSREGSKLRLPLEVRNAGDKEKSYRFGFSKSSYEAYDEEGVRAVGKIPGRDFYTATVAPAAFVQPVAEFDLPAGFEPKRIVLRIHTQVPGNDPQLEVFRIMLD